MDLTYKKYIRIGQIKIYDIGNKKEVIVYEDKIFRTLKEWVDFIKIKYNEDNINDIITDITSINKKE